MENPEFNVMLFNCQHVVTQIRYRQQVSVEVLSVSLLLPDYQFKD